MFLVCVIKACTHSSDFTPHTSMESGKTVGGDRGKLEENDCRTDVVKEAVDGNGKEVVQKQKQR